MSVIARRPATYADLEALPPHRVAEIVYGVLESHPRPSPPHSAAALGLGGELRDLFQKGRGGPGGWVFMVEPELRLGPHVLVPDVAGWRRERMPGMPDKAYVPVAPDWVCEVVSPSTARLDRGPKRRAYAESGVPHLWLLDPIDRVLEAFSLADGRWLLAGTVEPGQEVRLAPFDAAGFPFDDLFPFPPSTP